MISSYITLAGGIALNSLEQTFLLLPLALGLYISYCTLKATDMTVDGSFVTGAAIFAKLMSIGFSIMSCMVIALLGGSLCGFFVSLIQWRQRVDSLIASILMAFMLYSVNIQIMGTPNISLYDYETLVDYVPLINSDLISESLVLASFSAGIILLLIGVLFKTKAGLLFRAYGSNPTLMARIGYKPESIRTLGLALANSLAALSGALSAQVHGYADVNMGFGVALTTIGAIIIGRQLFMDSYSYFSIIRDLFSCSAGVLIYYLAVNLLLYLGIDPVNLKLVIGAILIFFLRTAARN